MSKGKLAVIIVACAAAIIATIALVASPPLQTTDQTEDYVLYVLGTCKEATGLSVELLELILEEYRPDSLTWQRDIANRQEQLEEIRAELAATPPPKSLSDKYPETADGLYEGALGYVGSITRMGYLILDYAHARNRGQYATAADYLAEYEAEEKTAGGYMVEVQLYAMLLRMPTP